LYVKRWVRAGLDYEVEVVTLRVRAIAKMRELEIPYLNLGL